MKKWLFLLLILGSLSPKFILATGPKVALTFDADLNKAMVSRLRKGIVRTYFNQDLANYFVDHKLPVTIFVTGMFVEEYSNDLAKLAKYPFVEIENHSYDHKSFTNNCFGLPKVEQSEKQTEIEKTQNIIYKLTGRYPRFFRFPGGCHSKTDDTLVENNKLEVAGWSIVGGDAFQKNPKVIQQKVKNLPKQNQVIVLHFGSANAPATAKALPKVVEELTSQGFKLVKLEEL